MWLRIPKQAWAAGLVHSSIHPDVLGFVGMVHVLHRSHISGMRGHCGQSEELSAPPGSASAAESPHLRLHSSQRCPHPITDPGRSKKVCPPLPKKGNLQRASLAPALPTGLCSPWQACIIAVPFPLPSSDAFPSLPQV